MMASLVIADAMLGVKKDTLLQKMPPEACMRNIACELIALSHLSRGGALSNAAMNETIESAWRYLVACFLHLHGDSAEILKSYLEADEVCSDLESAVYESVGHACLGNDLQMYAAFAKVARICLVSIV